MNPPGAHDFTVRGSQQLYRGAIFALRADEVVMPNGREARREVVEHYGSVAIVPVDEYDRVVLVHQYRHPLEKRLWEVPAGLLDVPGEAPFETARRELAEEAGLRAEEWCVLTDVATTPGMTDETVRVFLARGLSERPDAGTGDGDEEADLTIRRVPLPQAVSMAVAGEIINAPTVAGLFAAHLVLDGTATPRPADAPWPDRPTRFAARSAR